MGCLDVADLELRRTELREEQAGVMFKHGNAENVQAKD